MKWGMGNGEWGMGSGEWEWGIFDPHSAFHLTAVLWNSIELFH